MQFGPFGCLISLPLSNVFLSQAILSCLLAMVVFVLSSNAQPAGMSFTASDSDVVTDRSSRVRSMEERVFELINEERSKYGVQPLIWLDKAAITARSHSDDMAEFQYFSHADLGGRRVDDRADEVGLKDWRQIGENIAWLSGTTDPAKRVVDCWMNSEGHRHNILNPKFRETGLGLAISKDEKYYFTQVFVFRK